MARWTESRLIAYKDEWYDDSFDYNGPACYELGTGGPRSGDIQWHYVGETGNERERIGEYARRGSHLSEEIDWHLWEGWYLYYRARACATKEEAKLLQDRLLSHWKYDWNDKRNHG